MKIVKIGSIALRHWIKDFPVGKDIDLMMSYDDYVLFRESLGSDVIAHYPISNGNKFVIKTVDQIYEIEIAWKNSTTEQFMNLVESDPNTIKFSETELIPSIEALYTLKMSHRYLRNSPHFVKTLRHIKWMRSIYACFISDTYYSWYNIRMEETYNYIHPSLNTTKNDFFKEEPFYMYDHDDIHVSIKLGDVPAYTRILADDSPVKCDFKKFYSLSEEYKLACAVEECYTLALERSLIPNDFSVSALPAFKMALMKVCTSVTSGWFREWCWENYDMILNTYDPSFVYKFHIALETGKIRKFNHDRVY